MKVVPETQGLSFDSLDGGSSFWGDFTDQIEDEDRKGIFKHNAY